MSLVNVDAQYRLKDQELGQLKCRGPLPFSHISRRCISRPNMDFSGLLRGRGNTPMHKQGLSKSPLQPGLHNCLIAEKDRLNPKPGGLKTGMGTSRKQLASDLMVTRQMLETMSLANLVRFFTITETSGGP